VEHIETEAFIAYNIQACRLYQIQWILIPTATRVLLVVWEDMPILNWF